MRRRRSLIHDGPTDSADQEARADAGRTANLLGQNGPDHASDRYLAEAQHGDLVVPLDALSAETHAALEAHLGSLEARLLQQSANAVPVQDGLGTATEDDIPALLALGAAMHTETAFADIPLQLDRFETFLRDALADRARRQIFVHKSGGVLEAALIARASPYIFSDALLVSDELFYVFPAFRSYPLARRMIRAMEVWASSLGAAEVCLAVSTGTQIDRVDALYAKFRYRRVGGVYKKRL